MEQKIRTDQFVQTSKVKWWILCFPIKRRIAKDFVKSVSVNSVDF